MKEFIVTESDAFRLRVKSWKCQRPSDLNSLEFIQEYISTNGEINEKSIYNFFLTDEEIKELGNKLLKISE